MKFFILDPASLYIFIKLKNVFFLLIEIFTFFL